MKMWPFASCPPTGIPITIAEFRKRHLKALGGLFTQALLLCEKAGLVKLGHVAIDGTKIKAQRRGPHGQVFVRWVEGNFTDPESRIMPDGANKGSFVQGYNAQIAVDSASQVTRCRRDYARDERQDAVDPHDRADRDEPGTETGEGQRRHGLLQRSECDR